MSSFFCEVLKDKYRPQSYFNLLLKRSADALVKFSIIDEFRTSKTVSDLSENCYEG